MQEEESFKKARWSVMALAATLVLAAFGLAGCPDDDDDDIFKAAPAGIVQQE